MSDVGSCYDNAVAESFFGLLKRERVNRRRYRTRADARSDVFDYIERFYNRRRRHSHTNGLPPELLFLRGCEGEVANMQPYRDVGKSRSHA